MKGIMRANGDAERRVRKITSGKPKKRQQSHVLRDYGIVFMREKLGDGTLSAANALRENVAISHCASARQTKRFNTIQLRKCKKELQERSEQQ